MARSRKPGGAGSGRNSTPLPYTDQQKRTYEFANTRRTVNSGGTTKKMTNREIMELKQFETGARGNSVAQRDYLRRADLAEQSRREHIEADCMFWSHIKAKHQRQIDQARAAGLPDPKDLPHPDDIIIDWDDGPKFLGPRIEEELAIQMKTVALRDLLYVQQAMEDAQDSVPMRERPRHGGALMQAIFLNMRLAPSLRLSQSDEIDRCYRLSYRPLRELLKDCREAWGRFGAPARRGQRFGSAEALLPMLKACGNLIKAHKLIEDDPLGYEEAIEDAAKAIFGFVQSAIDQQKKTTRSGAKKKGEPK